MYLNGNINLDGATSTTQQHPTHIHPSVGSFTDVDGLLAPNSGTNHVWHLRRYFSDWSTSDSVYC